MDRQAWSAEVHGVAKSWTQLSDWTELNWVKAMVFPVVMYGYESWTIKKLECWRIYAFELWFEKWLEKTLESPLDSKDVKPVNPKGNQSWVFVGGTDVEVEASVLWLPDAKSQLTGKDPDAGKDRRQEERGKTEDKMVGWHHWLNGHELEQAPGVGDGQASPVCCSPWGWKESDTTERLNNNNALLPCFIERFSEVCSPPPPAALQQGAWHRGIHYSTGICCPPVIMPRS